MSVSKLIDVSRYVTPEDCPLCSSTIWRALVVDLESIAYYVLLDTAGQRADTYRPPGEDPSRPSWPRYEPRPEASSLSMAPRGPLWAHSCFIAVNVGGNAPQGPTMHAARRREAAERRARRGYL